MDNLDNEAKAEALYQRLKAVGSFTEGTVLEYEKILQLNPKHVGSLWEAARFYDGEYDHTGHGSYWDQFKCRDSDKARNYFRKIIELDPKFALAYKRLAFYCGQDKGKVLQYYLEYLHYFPQDNAAIAYFARLYHSLNRIQESIASFTKCLQHNQKDLIALHGLAAVYEDQGNFKEAIKCLQKSIEINHKRADTFAQMGHVYDKMGNIKEAITFYRRCNQIKADHKQANAYLKRHQSQH